MNHNFLKPFFLVFLLALILTGCSKKGLTTADMLKYSGRSTLPTQKDFPDDGGVYLFENIETHISFNPTWQASKEKIYHAAILYFNEKADPWLTPVIYLGKKDKLKNFHARTIKPDGQVIELTKDDLHSTQEKADFISFSDKHSVSFTFPGVVPGAIVEYSYKIKKERSSYYGQTWAIQSRLPKLYSHFSIEFPKSFLTKKHSWTFLPVNINLEPPHQKERSRTSGLLDFKTITYEWDVHDIKALRPGPQAPPYDDIAQYLRVDYKYKNWNALSKIYWDMIKDKFDAENSAALKKLALKVAGNAKNDAEKIDSVYAYLQKNFRYLAMDIGKSGLIPNSPDEIVKNKYGDCKDMSVLSCTLLHNLGIKAYPALVKTRDAGRLPSQIITFDFNHMIALAKTGAGKKYWLDATGSSCNLGEVYPSVEGTKALVIYPDGKSSLMKIPFSPASKNKMERHTNLYFDPNGHIHGNVKIVFKGNKNLAIRSSLRNLSRAEMRGVFMSYAASNQPDMTIDSLKYDNPAKIAKEFHLSFNFKLSDVKPVAKGLYIFNPAIFTIDTHLDRFIDRDRNYPIYFDDKSAIDDKVTIHYDPENFVLEKVPEHIFKQYAFGRVKVSSRKINDGKMTFQIIYKITEPLIGEANYTDFRELNKALAQSQQQKVALHIR